MTIKTQELDEEKWPAAKEYLVRQYRPNYFTGFETNHFRSPSRDEITNAPWMKNFKQDNFDGFAVVPYGRDSDELIVVANYKDGSHWVSAFAVPIDSRWVNNWRYGGSKSGTET